MCNDLNSDEWCRGEKAEIIKQRYRHPDDGEGEDIYRLMLMFEDYQRCIVNASGLTHKKIPGQRSRPDERCADSMQRTRSSEP